MAWRMNGWEDISQMDKWANRYNTLACSDTIGPKWAIVVGSKMRKNDADKILIASFVGPYHWVHTLKIQL